MDGYQVATLEDVPCPSPTSSITATGNRDIVTVEHMPRMKHQAILGNIGHFDNEIDMAGLATSFPGSCARRQAPGRQVDAAQRPRDHRAVRGAPAQPGQRDRAPELRDEQLLHQPDMAQIELYHEPRCLRVATCYILPKAPRREGRPAAPRRARREADDAHQAPGGLPGHRRSRGPTSPTPTATRPARVHGVPRSDWFGLPGLRRTPPPLARLLGRACSTARWRSPATTSSPCVVARPLGDRGARRRLRRAHLALARRGQADPPGPGRRRPRGRPPRDRRGPRGDPPDHQPGADRYVVLLDPAGHPFCLTTQIPED